MSDPSSASSAERRRNVALRRLIDEMLAQVRDAQRNAAAWTPEERQRAEADLEMIMARVRGAAASPAPPGGGNTVGGG
jgi:hypothetical protein